MLDKVPKSFLLGLSVASLICVIGLLIHLSVLDRGDSEDPHAGHDHGHGKKSEELSSKFNPNFVVAQGRNSHLGIYSKAAVTTDAEPCAQIGNDVLLRDGTAIDATIATLFCNSAVIGNSIGMGGGFVMTIFRKREGKIYNLMARETAPAASYPDIFVNSTESSYKGPLSVAVPGELLGYWEAKKKFGNRKVSWKSLIEPSIKLCEEGITVSQYFSDLRKSKSIMRKIRGDPNLSKTYIDPTTNELYKTGDVYKRPVYAESLRRVAENGIDEFYGGGETGKKFIDDLKEMGGILDHQDLRDYRIRWEERGAVAQLCNNFTIYAPPPPSSGAVLAGIMQILCNFGFTPDDANDVRTYQRYIEALKFSFAKRNSMGDWNDPEQREGLEKLVKELTSPRFGREKRLAIRDDWTSESIKYYGAEYSLVEDSGTTVTTVLAPNGDAVAVTSTINSNFGSGIMSPSTGIIYNNEMADFSIPGRDNNYGVFSSPANFVRPGMRPISSLTPSIILDDKKDVRLVIAGAGGPKMISGTAYVAMLNLWLGKNIKEAVAEPRLHHQLLPMEIIVEDGTKQEIWDYLEKVGHKVKRWTARASVVLGISIENGIVTANYDGRKSGQVKGF